MLAAIPSPLVDIGTACAILVGIVAAARTPVISRPGRAVWRRLVAEPVGEWFDTLLHRHTSVIREDVHGIDRRLENVETRVWSLQQEFRTNGGSSAKDQWDRLEHAVTPTEADGLHADTLRDAVDRVEHAVTHEDDA